MKKCYSKIFIFCIGLCFLKLGKKEKYYSKLVEKMRKENEKSHEKKWKILNNIIETAVGNNIRKLREKAGITQESLATKLQLLGCNITRSAIAKIEVGQRHLYPDEVIHIKNILKVSYEDIFKV